MWDTHHSPRRTMPISTTRTTIPDQNGTPISVDAVTLSATAKLALQLLIEKHQKESADLLLTVASDLGISPADGFQFHAPSQAFVRLPDSATDAK